MSKTIYLVTSGSYSDYTVHAAFSTKEKAEELIQLFKEMDRHNMLDPEIETYILDEHKWTTNKAWFIVLNRSSGDIIKCNQDFPTYLNVNWQADVKGNLYRHVVTDTQERAIKIAKDEWRQKKAENSLPPKHYLQET